MKERVPMATAQRCYGRKFGKWSCQIKSNSLHGVPTHQRKFRKKNFTREKMWSMQEVQWNNKLCIVGMLACKRGMEDQPLSL